MSGKCCQRLTAFTKSQSVAMCRGSKIAAYRCNTQAVFAQTFVAGKTSVPCCESVSPQLRRGRSVAKRMVALGSSATLKRWTVAAIVGSECRGMGRIPEAA